MKWQGKKKILKGIEAVRNSDGLKLHLQSTELLTAPNYEGEKNPNKKTQLQLFSLLTINYCHLLQRGALIC